MFYYVNKSGIMYKIVLVALTRVMQIDIIIIRLNDFSSDVYITITFFMRCTHFCSPVNELDNTDICDFI